MKDHTQGGQRAQDKADGSRAQCSKHPAQKAALPHLATLPQRLEREGSSITRCRATRGALHRILPASVRHCTRVAMAHTCSGSYSIKRITRAAMDISRSVQRHRRRAVSGLWRCPVRRASSSAPYSRTHAMGESGAEREPDDDRGLGRGFSEATQNDRI